MDRKGDAANTRRFSGVQQEYHKHIYREKFKSPLYWSILPLRRRRWQPLQLSYEDGKKFLHDHCHARSSGDEPWPYYNIHQRDGYIVPECLNKILYEDYRTYRLKPPLHRLPAVRNNRLFQPSFAPHGESGILSEESFRKGNRSQQLKERSFQSSLSNKDIPVQTQPSYNRSSAQYLGEAQYPEYDEYCGAEECEAGRHHITVEEINRGSKSCEELVNENFMKKVSGLSNISNPYLKYLRFFELEKETLEDLQKCSTDTREASNSSTCKYEDNPKKKCFVEKDDDYISDQVNDAVLENRRNKSGQKVDIIFEKQEYDSKKLSEMDAALTASCPQVNEFSKKTPSDSEKIYMNNMENYQMLVDFPSYLNDFTDMERIKLSKNSRVRVGNEFLKVIHPQKNYDCRNSMCPNAYFEISSYLKDLKALIANYDPFISPYSPIRNELLARRLYKPKRMVCSKKTIPDPPCFCGLFPGKSFGKCRAVRIPVVPLSEGVSGETIERFRYENGEMEDQKGNWTGRRLRRCKMTGKRLI